MKAEEGVLILPQNWVEFYQPGERQKHVERIFNSQNPIYTAWYSLGLNQRDKPEYCPWVGGYRRNGPDPELRGFVEKFEEQIITQTEMNGGLSNSDLEIHYGGDNIGFALRVRHPKKVPEQIRVGEGVLELYEVFSIESQYRAKIPAFSHNTSINFADRDASLPIEEQNIEEFTIHDSERVVGSWIEATLTILPERRPIKLSEMLKESCRQCLKELKCVQTKQDDGSAKIFFINLHKLTDDSYFE